ncbi:hypothetical protein, partial [Nocardioides kribbensis]|uniref:hypothetical protein n=1 Tax=Nocardioides kribbensis TaxID=305517 RepID=UPI0032DBE8DA
MSGRRGRPLTGSKKRAATGWVASLPTRRGSRTRSSWTFVTEKAADAWLSQGIAALNAGDPLPVPDFGDLVQVSRVARAGAGTQFRALGKEWKHERYIEIGTAGPGRETTVDGHVRRIADWMEERGLTMETMTRQHVKAFQADLTRSKPAAESFALPDGVDPDRLVTLDEGIAVEGTPSKSTLKRRIKSGALAAVETGSGAHRYRLGDLFLPGVAGGARAQDGSLRRGPRNSGALVQEVAADVMWVFNTVCDFAEDMGVEIP